MLTEATSSPTKVIMGCSKCGAALPEEAQFCLKCGKPVAAPVKERAIEESAPSPVQPRRKPRILLWMLLGLLLGLITWVSISGDPFAQGLQELIGGKHDQTVLETPFTVSAHNFRYYKFVLPEGSVHVSIVGQFTSASADTKTAKPKAKAQDTDGDIEVYVLSEPAFAVWQNGYATSSVFESGRVSKGDLQAELPAGTGVYYLVFSNKYAAKESKNINATILLRYKNWGPDWLRVVKSRLSNWLGLQPA